MPRDTRERMIRSTIGSLRRRGLSGTSFSDVLEDSGAARGAIYHHFPDGKRGMVQEAIERFGCEVAVRLRALEGESPRAVAAAFFNVVRPVVMESVGGSGCAAAAIATETSRDDGLFTAAGAVFAVWVGVLAERLAQAGADELEAKALAETLIVVLEGAHVLCRGLGTITPFDSAAERVVDGASPSPSPNVISSSEAAES